MYDRLPKELIIYIYSFDNTFHSYYNLCINELHNTWEKNITNIFYGDLIVVDHFFFETPFRLNFYRYCYPRQPTYVTIPGNLPAHTPGAYPARYLSQNPLFILIQK